VCAPVVHITPLTAAGVKKIVRLPNTRPSLPFLRSQLFLIPSGTTLPPPKPSFTLCFRRGINPCIPMCDQACTARFFRLHARLDAPIFVPHIAQKAPLLQLPIFFFSSIFAPLRGKREVIISRTPFAESVSTKSQVSPHISCVALGQPFSSSIPFPAWSSRHHLDHCARVQIEGVDHFCHPPEGPGLEFLGIVHSSFLCFSPPAPVQKRTIGVR